MNIKYNIAVHVLLSATLVLISILFFALAFFLSKMWIELGVILGVLFVFSILFFIEMTSFVKLGIKGITLRRFGRVVEIQDQDINHIDIKLKATGFPAIVGISAIIISGKKNYDMSNYIDGRLLVALKQKYSDRIKFLSSELSVMRYIRFFPILFMLFLGWFLFLFFLLFRVKF